MPLNLDQLPDSPFFANLKVEKQAESHQVTDFTEQLQQLDSIKAQRELLTSQVQLHVAKVLGMSSPNSVDINKGFFDMGMDSLTSVELKNRLQGALGCTLSSTVLFKYPNVGAVVGYLIEQVFALPTNVIEDDKPEAIQQLHSEPQVSEVIELNIAEQIEDLSTQQLEDYIDSTLDFLIEREL